MPKIYIWVIKLTRYRLNHTELYEIAKIVNPSKQRSWAPQVILITTEGAASPSLSLYLQRTGKAEPHNALCLQ